MQLRAINTFSEKYSCTVVDGTGGVAASAGEGGGGDLKNQKSCSGMEEAQARPTWESLDKQEGEGPLLHVIPDGSSVASGCLCLRPRRARERLAHL